MPSSVQTGKNIENYLRKYLRQLSLYPQDGNFRLIEEDLRLMKSGKQGGLDINWDIRFDLFGVQYKWFFEAKGIGITKYKNKNQYTNFQIKLIADKLLQLLGRIDLDIDCWCLFAPYLRLDENDKNLLRNLELHLPFRLLVWDGYYLPGNIYVASKKLFKAIYPNTNKGNLNKRSIDDYVVGIKKECIRGRFTKNIHERYLFLKQGLRRRCERKIILCKEPVINKKQPHVTTDYEYFLEVQGVKYSIQKAVLEKSIKDTENTKIGKLVIKTPKKENLLEIFKKAKNKDRKSLFNEIKNYLSKRDTPFAKFVVLHKYKDFKELDFIKLNSSSYFGGENNKDILFENIIEDS